MEVDAGDPLQMVAHQCLLNIPVWSVSEGPWPTVGSILHFGELLVQPSLAVDLVAKEFRNLRYLYRHSFVSNTLYECIRTFVCVEFVTNVTHCTGQCHVVKSKCPSFAIRCHLSLIFGNMSLIAKQDTIYSFHRIIHLVSSGYISTHWCSIHR